MEGKHVCRVGGGFFPCVVHASFWEILFSAFMAVLAYIGAGFLRVWVLLV